MTAEEIAITEAEADEAMEEEAVDDDTREAVAISQVAPVTIEVLTPSEKICIDCPQLRCTSARILVTQRKSSSQLIRVQK